MVYPLCLETLEHKELSGMSVKFVECDRETLYLLPPSLQDWLPEGHLARFVVDIVEQLDLRSLKESSAGRGSQPYNPVMLVALLFYGYATGVFSSRKLERNTYDSVAFRYVAANAHPDHDTMRKLTDKTFDKS
jgi:transposase